MVGKIKIRLSDVLLLCYSEKKLGLEIFLMNDQRYVKLKGDSEKKC